MKRVLLITAFAVLIFAGIGWVWWQQGAADGVVEKRVMEEVGRSIERQFDEIDMPKSTLRKFKVRRSGDFISFTGQLEIPRTRFAILQDSSVDAELVKFQPSGSSRAVVAGSVAIEHESAGFPWFLGKGRPVFANNFVITISTSPSGTLRPSYNGPVLEFVRAEKEGANALFDARLDSSFAMGSWGGDLWSILMMRVLRLEKRYDEALNLFPRSLGQTMPEVPWMDNRWLEARQLLADLKKAGPEHEAQRLRCEQLFR
jgi:hypothetical protein